ERAAATREDGVELSDGRAIGRNLVLDATKERFVDQLRWPDVGGEDDERHEGQLELLPARQREKVHARLEWDDPPVQHFARRASLPPEVVDDQESTVRHQLNRCV